MEKVKSFSTRLLQSLTLSSALFLAAPAMGQSFSSLYPAPGVIKTEFYEITRNHNSRLFFSGVASGQVADEFSSFPEYKDWRLLQTNSSGLVQFQHIVSTPLDDRAFEAVRSTLGDMLIVGHIGQGFTHADRIDKGLDPFLENAIPLLVRLNGQGVPVFQTIYEMNGLDDHAYSIVRENNNSYMILGRSFRNVQGAYAMTLLNVDLNGTVLSAQMWRDDVGSDFFPRKMLHTSDGGFLIAAVRAPSTPEMLHAPDPTDLTILGRQVAMIKLDAARNHVFTTLISPTDIEGIGVKDMVESSGGNVTFVGMCKSGPYAMTIDDNGNIVQSKRYSVGSGDLKWEPKSIARISNGFAVAGSVDLGPGVPRIELSNTLNVLNATRHQFGKNINAIETISISAQYLAGGTTDDALVVGWGLQLTPPVCNLQNEQVTEGPFPHLIESIQMDPTNIQVTPTNVSLITSPAATRIDNCPAPAPKMSIAAPSAEAAVSVSPNPARDQLQLFVPGEEDAAYTLHDLQGRLLADGTLRPGSQALPVADLARGVYVLRIHNTQFNSTHRISLQH
jgi:hypothetical protein